MAQIKRHMADLWVDKLQLQYPNISEKVAEFSYGCTAASVVQTR